MSYRVVRNKHKRMSEERTIEFLLEHNIGHLAMVGDEGYPYIVPLNYCYSDGKIILHAAMEGYKLDLLRKCNDVSFTVSEQHYIKTEGRTPCKDFQTPFSSVILFGKANLIEGEDKIKYLTEFAKFYLKTDNPPVDEKTSNFMMRTAVIVIDILHITGKESDK